MRETTPGLDLETDPERWADTVYAEMLAGPEWPADVRSAPGPGDPELEAAEAEPEAGL